MLRTTKPISSSSGRFVRCLGLTVGLVLLGAVGTSTADVDCVVTHFPDGTCATTCYFTNGGKPAGYLNCSCC